MFSHCIKHVYFAQYFLCHDIQGICHVLGKLLKWSWYSLVSDMFITPQLISHISECESSNKRWQHFIFDKLWKKCCQDIFFFICTALRVIFRENQTWSGMCDVTDFNELWGYQTTIGRYFDCKFFSPSAQW